MERALLVKIKIIIVSVGVLAAVLTVGYAVYQQQTAVSTVTDAQHQLTEISYRGHNGVDALTLLKQHARVEVKHYSFGDMVTAINGNKGTGPKYWTFYANGKQSEVGASAYRTKDGDVLRWKLHQL